MSGGKAVVEILRLEHAADLPLPAPATANAAGVDLRAALREPITLEPGARALIPTGFQLAIAEGYEGQVRPRSGLALKHGIGLPNAPGTIDADYRGEVGVILVNHGDDSFMIHHGDRIAQLVIQRMPSVEWREVETLSETARGAGGFGHTGRR
jgi:dUTP pyrophosphatase